MEQHIFSPEEKHAFATKPGVLNEYRKGIERGVNGQFGIFMKNTNSQKEVRENMILQMQKKLHNKNLERVLIPQWPVGCRRITPGVNYLESLTAENVEVVYGNIDAVTERGCVCDDGKEYAVDVLICATGFDTSFKPRFPLVGPKGNNLQDDWKDEPRSYFGIGAANIPNYLMFLGPNSPIGNGPVLSAVGKFASWLRRQKKKKGGPWLMTYPCRGPSRLHDAFDRQIPNAKHYKVRSPRRRYRRVHRFQGPIHGCDSLVGALPLMV